MLLCPLLAKHTWQPGMLDAIQLSSFFPLPFAAKISTCSVLNLILTNSNEDCHHLQSPIPHRHCYNLLKHLLTSLLIIVASLCKAQQHLNSDSHSLQSSTTNTALAIKCSCTCVVVSSPKPQ